MSEQRETPGKYLIKFKKSDFMRRLEDILSSLTIVSSWSQDAASPGLCLLVEKCCFTQLGLGEEQSSEKVLLLTRL